MLFQCQGLDVCRLQTCSTAWQHFIIICNSNGISETLIGLLSVTFFCLVIWRQQEMGEGTLHVKKKQKKDIHKSHTKQVPFRNRNRHVGSKNSSDTCHREVFHNLKTSFIHHFELIYELLLHTDAYEAQFVKHTNCSLVVNVWFFVIHWS